MFITTKFTKLKLKVVFVSTHTSGGVIQVMYVQSKDPFKNLFWHFKYAVKWLHNTDLQLTIFYVTRYLKQEPDVQIYWILATGVVFQINKTNLTFNCITELYKSLSFSCRGDWGVMISTELTRIVMMSVTLIWRFSNFERWTVFV